MQLLPTLIVAALAGLAGVTLGRKLAPEAVQAEQGPSDSERDALEAALAQGEKRLAELATQQASADLAPARAAYAGPDDGQLAAALARWRALHPEADGQPEPAPSQPSGRLANGTDLATAPIEEVARELAATGFGNEEREQLFEKLRALGRMDEYVAEMERLAAASPEDVGLQVALGHAYLQKLFGMGSSPEVGEIAWKSDQAFDRALELDETSWDARFTKAVALSNWPAFLGRGSEAIEHFELLIEQQESQPDQDHFALPYLFLGNMLQASGKQKEALEAWRDGLAKFPENEQLLAALAAAGGR